ncbi:fimbrial biogenesis chaperone [Citrobacter koseri]|uniref:fimbrial biogenesis chaperone n=1 Tax=Citrobacter koseri TaxID=545 RepID=UPI0015F27866|nr:molecular chaperone [Citrobacter koseri]
MLCQVSGAAAGQRPAGPVKYPGFGLGFSRVVVAEGDRSSGQVTAVNNSDNVYLVQSRVWPADGTTGYPLTGARDDKDNNRVPVPFLVTPPLKRLESWSTMQLRIITTPDNHLPADRESLFFLSSKAIPSVAPVKADPGRVTAQMSMALQSFIKLYYRPKALDQYAIFDGKVAPRLTFSRPDGGHIRVTNPTPYHITFAVLTVGGKAVDAEKRRAMVPPLGDYDYPLPDGTTGREVKWQIIDEFGLVTNEQHMTLP